MFFLVGVLVLRVFFRFCKGGEEVFCSRFKWPWSQEITCYSAICSIPDLGLESEEVIISASKGSLDESRVSELKVFFVYKWYVLLVFCRFLSCFFKKKFQKPPRLRFFKGEMNHSISFKHHLPQKERLREFLRSCCCSPWRSRIWVSRFST